jgi:hypothetical protein
MNELVVLFAILGFVALAGYAVRGLIRRASAGLEESDLEDGEAFKKSPHAVWRELDRQRTRRDVRHHWH